MSAAAGPENPPAADTAAAAFEPDPTETLVPDTDYTKAVPVRSESWLEVEESVKARFFTAFDGHTPTPEQIAAARLIRDHAHGFATAIEMYTPEGRNKSLANTALEDALIRAIRGIFE